MVNQILVPALKILYLLATLGLSVIGFNILILTILYLSHANDQEPERIALSDDELPEVLIQLPVFNERYVVARLIKALAEIDYPRDKLTIQVLDDSTDDTPTIISETLSNLSDDRMQFNHIRREVRAGYKAGALNDGMASCDAPFIAIFDADFVPDPDFLRQTIPYFIINEKLGMVQTRWAHTNQDDSLLTGAQALALDAHFVIEQTARHRTGLFMNFSGTAGVWRRICIDDSGGWQHDTLSEDIDLSYRAQMKGWEFLYLPAIGVKAEIPAMMMGFKRQQARWATGTVQVLRKLGKDVLEADISIWKKISGIIHLGGYFIHPLMLLVLLLSIPVMLLDGIHILQLSFLGLAMIGSPLEVIISQRYLHPEDWGRRLLIYPVFMFFGMGIIVSNTTAVLKGLSTKPQEFKRTPKVHRSYIQDTAIKPEYFINADITTIVEVLLSLIAFFGFWISLTRAPSLSPFLLLYGMGTGYVASVSIIQSWKFRKHNAILTTSDPSDTVSDIS